MSAPAAVGGHRLLWEDLPEEVRQIIETRLAAGVVSAINQPGGFSPGLASRLLLRDGRRVFAKAVSADRSEVAATAHRREARILAGLPTGSPAPRLLWFGEHADWTMLVMQDIDGHMPAQPWSPAEFDLVLTALTALADRLTPSPCPAPYMVDDLADDFAGWRELAANPGPRPEAFAWAWANLERLAALEATWPAAAADGDTLLHGDLRADNMLVTPGGLIVVDWPGAVIGPAWADLVGLMPSAMMQGIADPEAVWRRFAPATKADPDAVNAVLAAYAGYFVSRSLQPARRFLPTLRAFQAAQGVTALQWLRLRLS